MTDLEKGILATYHFIPATKGEWFRVNGPLVEHLTRDNYTKCFLYEVPNFSDDGHFHGYDRLHFASLLDLNEHLTVFPRKLPHFEALCPQTGSWNDMRPNE